MPKGIVTATRAELVTGVDDIVRISNPGDERITAYRNIKERDLVGRQGRFIAEGRVVLRALLESRYFATESILILENRLKGLAPELQLKSPDTPVYAAPQDIIDQVAGFPLHRGILAIGKRPQSQPAAIVPPREKDCLIAVCIGISNHDNIGAIFRNAAAFGASAVLLDETCCDPLYRKSLRVSVGAALKVPFAKGGTAKDILNQLSSQNVALLALSPGAERPLTDIPAGKRRAIVLGGEGDGLPADILAGIPSVSIAMAPGFDSLNVAAASAIALHHLATTQSITN